MMIFGGFMLLGALSSFSIPGMVVSSLILGSGNYLARKAQTPALPSTGQNQAALNPTSEFKLTDQLIIRLAHRNGNQLSPEFLAKQTSLSIQEARERLDLMSQQGLCQIDLDKIDANGNIIYVFL
ncbi:hypothetical protein [Eisenibacter elegans]|uniref:hypothetical protein n=1 Tax=Eisenibacter elegans TaxID=997 RepID=UPI0012B62D37|nr:hypothetical protein [Eisenibacter elegans]